MPSSPVPRRRTARPPRALAFAALVLPLIALMIFGSAELARQTERAERALAAQAHEFLREARRAVDSELSRADALLQNLPELGTTPIASAARLVRNADPAALDLIVLTADGSLLFPRVPPTELEALPFQRPSSIGAIRRAEALELLGDRHGAHDLLTRVVSRLAAERVQPPQEDPLLRAHFDLARLLRGTGELDAAAEHYEIAAAAATSPASRRGESPAARATIALWCDLALAELDVETGAGPGRAVRIAQSIADGLHDAVADPMLEAVLAALGPACQAEAEAVDAWLEACEADVARREGRAFASDYALLLQESVRRRLQRGATTSPLRLAIAEPDGASLLALRPTAGGEFGDGPDELLDAAWIGVRMDLEQLLADAVADDRTATARAFALQISDAEGTPIAPIPTPTAATVPALEPPAELTADAGIRLAALPLDPTTLLAERSRTIRNRALLLLLLCVTAGGGALLLVRSVARESELAKLKVELLSRVSHDLKTPLALIRMYAETIGRGRARTPEETAQFAGIVQREADVLTRMVERLLDFSRQEAGSNVGERSLVELTDALHAVADAYRPHAAARDLPLRVVLPPEPVHVIVEPSGLESAILDLLENAVKYTPPDTPGAAVVLLLTTDHDHAVIEVQDDGHGIPQAERERVFDSFYRASNAGEARGSGLGLALVRHFARRHGGHVEAHRREPRGTTIRLVLPRAAPAAGDRDSVPRSAVDPPRSVP